VSNDPLTIQLVARLIFFALFVLALVELARRRDRLRLEVLALFSTLGIVLMVQWISSLTGREWHLPSLVAVAAFVAQPYLLVRLATHFRPVPRLQAGIALAGLLGSWGLLILLVAGKAPTWATLPLVAAFAYVEGYATFAFVRAATALQGVTRRRLVAIATGSGFLATTILLAGLRALVGLPAPIASSLTDLLVLGSALGFYAGFEPPGWLRRAWQMSVLRRFLAGLAQQPADERMHTALDEVSDAAVRAAGGKAGFVLLGEPAAGELQLYRRLDHEHGATAPSTHAGPAATGPPEQPPLRIHPGPNINRAWLEQQPVVAPAQSWGPGLGPLAAAAGGAQCALVVPIAANRRCYGVLIVFLERGPLFVEDELPLLSLLAEQAALAIEASELLEASERERAMLAAITRSMTDGLLVIDAAGRISYCNPRAAELLQVDCARLLGQTPRAALGQLWPKELDAPAGNERFELSIAAPVRRDVQIQLFPITNGRGEIGVLLHDVTSEREVDRLKDEFVSVVSHELRTPLSSVLGFTELLLERELPPERRREFLQTMYRDGTRLKNLIDDFLDLQRMEAGRQQYARELLAPAAVIEQAVAPFRLEAQRHRLRVEVPEELPPVVGDPDRLRQVLVNLIDNAIKYSPNGGEVLITAQQRGRSVEIAVQDQGLGLPAEAIPRLFQKFYRVDMSDRREIKGTGLGLAICRQIVEAHGGRMWAESAGPGRGSTFGFTLPLAPAEMRDAIVESGIAAAPSVTMVPARDRAGGTVRVLVVEDDESMVRLYREHLEAAGYAVDAVVDGAQALAQLRQTLPDAVVLDILLPGRLDGWAVLAEIKADPALSRLPVIVATVVDEEQRGTELGAADYLVKPIDMGRLLRSLALATAGNGREVLIADDDAGLRAMLREALAPYGYAIREAADGAETIRELERRRPDVLLLDLLMPEVDGFEILRRLRDGELAAGAAAEQEDGQALRSLPVIVLTGKTLTLEERRRLAARSALLIRKGERLTDTILSALRRHLGPLPAATARASPPSRQP
jgi:signal transduction histidine kinase/DNA-binding response OmpR family regulator